jgi:hypothetical protein
MPCGLTFEGEACREPVDLARGIVEDLVEAEAVEPPRGSRADVSGVVEAVHDDRTRAIQNLARLLFEVTQREVDRPGKVGVAVLVRRQDVDEPNARQLEHPLQFFALDRLHGASSDNIPLPDGSRSYFG